MSSSADKASSPESKTACAIRVRSGELLSPRFMNEDTLKGDEIPLISSKMKYRAKPWIEIFLLGGNDMHWETGRPTGRLSFEGFRFATFKAGLDDLEITQELKYRRIAV